MPSTNLSNADSVLYDPAIPPKRDALIGREQDLARIKQRLYDGGNAALTVLHGLPGVGKTALAIALAHDDEICAYFSGGVLWAGLGPNPNIFGILSHWAEVLGLSVTERARLLSNIQELASAIRNAIGLRKVIVIIDDVWQYEDVQALRVGAQNCAHLVTTRHRAIAAQMTPNAIMISELDETPSIQLLNRAMQGEHVGTGQAAVGTGVSPANNGQQGNEKPLSAPAHHALSGQGGKLAPTIPTKAGEEGEGGPREGERGPKAGTSPASTDETTPEGDEHPALAQSMQNLVQAVGGLPLALTLVGNYVRKQAQQSNEPISAVLERLSSVHIRLQITEMPPSTEAHPSLSDDTLPSLQSIIAITDRWLPERARQALYILSIFPPKPDTFTEEAAIAVTSCTYNELDLLSDVGLLESYRQRCTLHQVISDYARIHLKDAEEREAQSRLVAYVADYVEAHKRDYELLDLESPTIYRALAFADTQGKHHELIRTICAFAPFLILRGFYRQAEPHLKRGYDAAVELDDKEGITSTLLYLGEIEQRQGNYAQAETHLQQGLTLARQMNNNERVCALLTQLGIVFQEQGNFQQAETAYQEGLTLARNIADHESTCLLLNNLGSLTMRRGEFAQSKSYLQEGLALARKIEDRERVSGLLRILGAVEIYRGNYVQAQSCLQEGLTLARSLGDREHICTHLINLGMATNQQGKTSQAKMYYQEGLELARQIGHRDRICSVLMNLGHVFVEEGNYVQGEIYLQEGLELAQQIGHREWMSILLLNLGMTARKQGHYDEAKPYLQESLALANQINRSHVICAVLCELGDLSLSEGKIGPAGDYFKKMRDLIPSGEQQLLALAYYGLARVCASEGDRENARLYGNKSVTLFETMGHRKVAEVRDWMKSALG